MSTPKMRTIQEIAHELAYDYKTTIGSGEFTDLYMGTGYDRTYSDTRELWFEADGRDLFIVTEIGVSLPDGADPDINEGEEAEVIGYTWAFWDTETDQGDPYRVDGTDSEEAVIETITQFVEPTTDDPDVDANFPVCGVGDIG